MIADPLNRLLDRLEHALWAGQDERLTEAGWEVVRQGRWNRRYRHPQAIARAVAVASPISAHRGPAWPTARPAWRRLRAEQREQAA